MECFAIVIPHKVLKKYQRSEWKEIRGNSDKDNEKSIYKK
jgi:hypothetical protein